MSFATRLQNSHVPPNTICLYWLGQAGFAIKTTEGKLILIDPYFTDSVYHIFQKENGFSFKRLSAPLLDPDDLVYDEIYISHEHEDHLDVEAFPTVSQGYNTMIYCSNKSAEILKTRKVETSKITVTKIGDQIHQHDYSVKILKANHGELCPLAQGFLFDFGFTKIYYSGDTCYDEAIIQQVAKEKPDICLLPINGAFGNLDHQEALKFAQAIHGKVLIPHHFWTFPLHLGDPLKLIQQFDLSPAPDIMLQFLMPGEPFLLQAGSDPIPE